MPKDWEEASSKWKKTLIVPIKEKTTIRAFTGPTISLSREDLEKSMNRIVEIYHNFDHFMETIKPRMLATIAKVHKLDLPAQPGVDFKATAKEAWVQMIARAYNVQQAVNRKPGKLVNRRYEVVTDLSALHEERRRKETLKLVPQALACLQILLSEGTNVVLESRMKELIEINKAKFNSKQDPWRIWQYYRPQLISLRWVMLK